MQDYVYPLEHKVKREWTAPYLALRDLFYHLAVPLTHGIRRRCFRQSHIFDYSLLVLYDYEDKYNFLKININ